MLENKILHGLKGSLRAKEDFYAANSGLLCQLINKIISVLQSKNKILIFGNGGSAADAQHMAAEFVNRFLIDRPPQAAIALTTDSSILTSIANDFSFDDIFAKQVIALGRQGDLVLGISTSGNSLNVIKAIEVAKDLKMHSAVLTGGTGGKLLGLADFCLNVPTSFTPHIQETHLWIEHIICQYVDEQMFGEFL